MLASLIGASDTFVLQVKTLFSRKGIPLESDAEPYVLALEEAFRREESIRVTTTRARASIVQLEQNFSRIGEAYVRQLDQLKRIQVQLHKQTRQLTRDAESNAEGNTEVQIPGGDHRTLVTRTQQERLPMVPGPDEQN